MHPKARKRSWTILAFLMCATGVSLIILGALRENVVFFVTPSEWIEKQKESASVSTKMMRLGGMVEKQSLLKEKDQITFKITDGKHSINVFYQGVLPDLFRENQGVVAEGNFEQNGSFKATRILAKHDENYMPKEVAERMHSSTAPLRGDFSLSSSGSPTVILGL